MSTLRAGTRGSQLAWTQTGGVLETILKAFPGTPLERVRVETRGDRDQHTPLATLPGTGLFTKELEAELLRGGVDFAVHSLKDVPFEIAAGTCLFHPRREDPRDALLSPHGSLSGLPEGARVGTGSPRRIAQLRAVRPDLRFSDLRGNLDTRLRRLDAGEYDAIVLAAAGLERLGWAGRIAQRLDPDICLPAFGQGILGLQCRASDEGVLAVLDALEDPDAALCAALERDLMRALGGGCKTALAALAEVETDSVRLRGMVGDHVTGRLVRRQWRGPRASAPGAVEPLARELLAAARGAGVPGFA